MSVTDILRRLADRRGAAAIEIAMIAPVIAGLAVASFSIWEVASRRQDQRAALDVAAEYYMNGGTDDATARSLAMSAWRAKPADAALNIDRSCRCVTVVTACGTICSGGRTAATYVSLAATATQPSASLNKQLTLNRVIRVR